MSISVSACALHTIRCQSWYANLTMYRPHSSANDGYVQATDAGKLIPGEAGRLSFLAFNLRYSKWTTEDLTLLVTLFSAYNIIRQTGPVHTGLARGLVGVGGRSRPRRSARSGGGDAATGRAKTSHFSGGRPGRSVKKPSSRWVVLQDTVPLPFIGIYIAFVFVCEMTNYDSLMFSHECLVTLAAPWTPQGTPASNSARRQRLRLNSSVQHPC